MNLEDLQAKIVNWLRLNIDEGDKVKVDILMTTKELEIRRRLNIEVEVK